MSRQFQAALMVCIVGLCVSSIERRKRCDVSLCGSDVFDGTAKICKRDYYYLCLVDKFGACGRYVTCSREFGGPKAWEQVNYCQTMCWMFRQALFWQSDNMKKEARITVATYDSPGFKVFNLTTEMRPVSEFVKMSTDIFKTQNLFIRSYEIYSQFQNC